MENNLDIANQPNIQPEPVAEKPFPSINQALGLIGILLLVSIIVVIPLIIVQKSVNADITSLINALGYALSVGIVLFIGMHKRKYKKILWQRVSWKVILLLIPLVFSAAILMEPLEDAIPMPEIVKEAFAKLFTNDIYSFITIVILAPVLEELIFRGIILDGFLKRYSPVKAIIWSSIFFGIAHMNPWQFIGAFGFGLIIGWVYLKSNSIIPCIAIHFFNNLFGFITIMYSGNSMITAKQIMGDSKLYFVLFGICIPIFIGSLITISKRLKAKTIVNTHPNS